MIYHLAIRSEWDSHVESTYYAPAHFEDEGFIHCSEKHQLQGVSNRVFRGRDDLLLLKLDPTRLEANTTYESGGSMKFPHVYGKIDKASMIDMLPIRCNADGTFDGVFDGLES